MCIQTEKYSVQNHDTKENKRVELKVLNLIKKKCADLSSLLNDRKQSPRDIFYSVLSDHKDVKLDFFTHERTLERIRAEALPKNPEDIHEIAKLFDRDDIRNMLGITKDGKPFYNGVYEGEGFSFCVFSSQSIMKLYCARVKFGDRMVMMDGTFGVVPVGTFNQLLLIHAIYMEKVIEIK